VLMTYRDFLIWAEKEFGFSIPGEYLDFLKNGDFKSALRKNYVVDLESGSVLEISDWFICERVPEIYKNCRDEKLIEKYHLPIFDSCGCTVLLNCNPQSPEYGYVFSRASTGYYDEDLQENVYPELDFAAKSFSEIISNLKSTEELEELGL